MERLDLPFIKGVRCQRLFSSGAYSFWFEVEKGRLPIFGEPPALPIPGITGMAMGPDALLPGEQLTQAVKAQLRLVQEHSEQTLEKVAEKYAANLWLRRTQWVDQLHHIPAPRLRNSIAATYPGEEASDAELLGVMLESLDRLLKWARQASQLAVAGIAALREVNRADITKPSFKPLNVNVELATWNRYSDTWKYILRFVFRWYNGQAAEDAAKDKKRPYAGLTDN